MNTRSTRSRAKRANDVEDASIEIIEVEQPKKKKLDPEVINLEEEEIKPVKPDVQCLDIDVITVEDDEDILCVEETKATINLEHRVPEPRQQQRVRTIEVIQVIDESGVRDIKCIDISQPDRVLTRRQKALVQDPSPKISEPPAASPRKSPRLKPADPTVGLETSTPSQPQPSNSATSGAKASSASQPQHPPKPAAPAVKVSACSQAPRPDSVSAGPKVSTPGPPTPARDACPPLRQETPKPIAPATKSSSTTARRNTVDDPPKRAVLKRELKTEVEPTPTTSSSWDSASSGALVPKAEPLMPVVKTQPPEQEAGAVVPSTSNTVSQDNKDDVDDGEVEACPEHFRKLFVGRVSYQSTPDSIKKYFERWGRILEVFLPRDQVTHRHKGFAFITFAKSSFVDAIQKARPHRVDGREVDSKRAFPKSVGHLPQARLTVKKVFLYGLRGFLTERNLEDYFKSYGTVLSCRIVQTRGFGFVEFDDHDPVDKIFMQKMHNICGRRVGTDKAVGKQVLSSFRFNRYYNNNYNNYNNYDNYYQRWSGMNPRGSQYSRRPEPYYETPSWRRYEPWQSGYGYNGVGNGYQSHAGGGPVRSYYGRRYSPYYSYSSYPSSTQRQGYGYSGGSVVFNWSARQLSSNVRDTSSWGSQGYSSSFNLSHSNTTQTSNHGGLFSGLLNLPMAGTSQSYQSYQSYNYPWSRR